MNSQTIWLLALTAEGQSLVQPCLPGLCRGGGVGGWDARRAVVKWRVWAQLEGGPRPAHMQ